MNRRFDPDHALQLLRQSSSSNFLFTDHPGLESTPAEFLSDLTRAIASRRTGQDPSELLSQATGSLQSIAYDAPPRIQPIVLGYLVLADLVEELASRLHSMDLRFQYFQTQSLKDHTYCQSRDSFERLMRTSMLKDLTGFIVFDICDFGQFNKIGYPVGTEAIRQISHHVSELFFAPGSPFGHIQLFHWGGDEFVVFAEKIKAGADLKKLQRRIKKRLAACGLRAYYGRALCSDFESLRMASEAAFQRMSQAKESTPTC